MKNLKSIFSIAILLCGFALPVSAQSGNPPANEKTKVSLEIDPSTFVFKGYGIHLRIQPKHSQHLLVGGGAYALNMPDFLVGMNKKNRDQGWKVRLNQGYGLFGEHHFTEVNRKWFAGIQLGVQQFKIENEATIGSERFTNFLAMGYFGYTFKPFGDHFYLKPWAGMGYTKQLSGERMLETAAYDIAPVTLFVTLHIGYTF